MSIGEKPILHHWETRGRRFKSSRSDHFYRIVSSIRKSGVDSNALVAVALSSRRDSSFANADLAAPGLRVAVVFAGPKIVITSYARDGI
jgi:hypothetical protein